MHSLWCQWTVRKTPSNPVIVPRPTSLESPFILPKTLLWLGHSGRGRALPVPFSHTYTHKQTLWPWLRILGPNHYSCLCLCWVLEQQASGAAWRTGVPWRWTSLVGVPSICPLSMVCSCPVGVYVMKDLLLGKEYLEITTQTTQKVFLNNFKKLYDQ